VCVLLIGSAGIIGFLYHRSSEERSVKTTAMVAGD